MTGKQKKESVDKWKSIVSAIKKEQKRFKDVNEHGEPVLNDYRTMFWIQCSFCRVYERCCYCPLSVRSKEQDELICHSYSGVSSHAYLALECADREDWEEALFHAQIVLNAIKAVKVEKKRMIREEKNYV